MEELIANLSHISLQKARDIAFVDTCFFIDELAHHKDEELEGRGLAMLSFNVEELVHVARHLPSDKKQHIRHFLRDHPQFLIVDVPIKPGDRKGEHAFVAHIDEKLLQIIPDPSDAVLLAAAVARRCPVLTKDKHHLFTAALENYVNDYGIRVFKEMKDYLDWKENHSTFEHNL